MVLLNHALGDIVAQDTAVASTEVGPIFDAATELFLTHGYGATSIEAVAQRVRISKRTFYHRFDDKAALLARIASDGFRLLRETLVQALATAVSAARMLIGTISTKATVSPRCSVNEMSLTAGDEAD